MNMTPRDITLTDDQIRLIKQWANDAWHDADQARMLTRPGSPQEAACLADQLDIEQVRAVLRASR